MVGLGGLLLLVSAIAVTVNFEGSDLSSNFWFEVNKAAAWFESLQPAGELAGLIPFMAICGSLVLTCLPKKHTVARVVVCVIAFVLSTRYIVWRVFSILDSHDSFWVTVFRCGFFLTECVLYLNNALLLLQISLPTDRKAEADQAEMKVREGYYPSVDVLIPTYNEEIEILKKTLCGAQAISYPNKTVYLLDDTDRPEAKELAESLGCVYIARPTRGGAKAGNLNYTLVNHARGELVAVFDADFVASRNFLSRTVGFFLDSQVAIVQTPQVFFDSDFAQRNLGLHKMVTHEEDLFFRVIQPGRDQLNSAICHGTSFMIRRSILDEVGLVPTETITEDFCLGITVQSFGYRLIYLNEALSCGNCASTLTGSVAQRVRWAQGTWQTMISKSSPLTVKNLSLLQRIVHFSGSIYWLTGVCNLVLLLVPLIFLVFGVGAMNGSVHDVIAFWLPYYLFNSLAFCWLSHGRRSFFWSDVYMPIMVFPLTATFLKTLINPFGSPFRVTPKKFPGSGLIVNWQLAWPLLLILFLYLIGFSMFLMRADWSCADPAEGQAMLFWSGYSCVLLLISLQLCLDVSSSERLALRCKLTGRLRDNQSVIEVELSELGDRHACLVLRDNPVELQDEEAVMEILPIGVQALKITGLTRRDSDILVEFDAGLTDYARLIAFVFQSADNLDIHEMTEFNGILCFWMSLFRLYPLTR